MKINTTLVSKLSDTSDVAHRCRWSGWTNTKHKTFAVWYNEAATTQTSKVIRHRNNATDVLKKSTNSANVNNNEQ